MRQLPRWAAWYLRFEVRLLCITNCLQQIFSCFMNNIRILQLYIPNRTFLIFVLLLPYVLLLDSLYFSFLLFLKSILNKYVYIYHTYIYILIQEYFLHRYYYEHFNFLYVLHSFITSFQSKELGAFLVCVCVCVCVWMSTHAHVIHLFWGTGSHSYGCR